jgi:hypothetical protein
MTATSLIFRRRRLRLSPMESPAQNLKNFPRHTHSLSRSFPVQILVVDDDLEFRCVLADALTDLGWTVRSTASGIDAVRLLRS